MRLGSTAALACGIALTGLSAMAESNMVIQSFGANGSLTYEVPATSIVRHWVEWAPQAGGPWAASWQSAGDALSTGGHFTVSVPMFYRVMAQILDDADLIGFYPFSGNAQDMSGQAHTGVVSNASYTDDRFTNASRALAFGASAGWVDCGDPVDNSYEMTGDFTIVAWIKLSEPFNSTYANAIVAKDSGPGGNTAKWGLFGYGNKLGYHVCAPGYGFGDWVYSESLPDLTNAFHHVGMSKQGNACTFYLDGLARGTTNLPNPVVDVAASLTLGYAEPVHYLQNAVLDEVRLYKRALTSNEVAAVYALP